MEISHRHYVCDPTLFKFCMSFGKNILNRDCDKNVDHRLFGLQYHSNNVKNSDFLIICFIILEVHFNHVSELRVVQFIYSLDPRKTSKSNVNFYLEVIELVMSRLFWFLVTDLFRT